MIRTGRASHFPDSPARLIEPLIKWLIKRPTEPRNGCAHLPGSSATF